MTSCQKALQDWSAKEGQTPEEAETVKLMCMIPPINKMDTSLNNLANVKHLALSTNAIDKMISLPNLKNLEILSLGRNQIKKIQGLEEVGASLKQLWLSYNHISSLDGLHSCVKLTHLFMSNNKLKNWDELSKLGQNPELVNVLFVGNPMYEGFTRKTATPQILRRLPSLKTIDGEMAVDMGADDTVVAVKDSIVSKYQSVEDALDQLGIDIQQALDQAAFQAALANLEVSADDAAHIFSIVDDEGTGSVTLEKLADTFENA